MKIISTFHTFPAPDDDPHLSDPNFSVVIDPPEDGAQIVDFTMWRDDGPAPTGAPGASRVTLITIKWIVYQKKADEKPEESSIEQDTALLENQIVAGMMVPKEYLEEPAFSMCARARRQFEHEEQKKYKELLTSAVAKHLATVKTTQARSLSTVPAGTPWTAAATHALSIVNLLNEALDYDRLAIEQLIEHRVTCSDYMLKHPTIQVDSVDGLGMLGILNGIVGAIEEGPKKGCGWIDAVYDDDENLTHFKLNLP